MIDPLDRIERRPAMGDQAQAVKQPGVFLMRSELKGRGAQASELPECIWTDLAVPDSPALPVTSPASMPMTDRRVDSR